MRRTRHTLIEQSRDAALVVVGREVTAASANVLGTVSSAFSAMLTAPSRSSRFYGRVDPKFEIGRQAAIDTAYGFACAAPCLRPTRETADGLSPG